MSVNAVTSGNPLQELANLLVKNYDSNGDGKLGAEEFSDLVKSLANQFGVTNAETSYKATTASTPIVGLTASTLPFEGFDLGRPQDTSKSAKDAFAMLAMRAGTLPRTKGEAEQWFNTNIKSGMEALGHKINWVQGDKFSFTNWQGTFAVDFVRGADGGSPAFSWQAENA